MKGIAAKLWGAMMALIIVILIMLWLFQITFLEQFYVKIRVDDIKKEALHAVNMIEEDNFDKFMDTMDELAYNNNLTAELVDINYDTLYSTGQMGMGGGMHMMMGNRIQRDAYQKVFEGKEISVPMTHPRFGSGSTLIGIPVIIDESVQGGLFLILPLVPVNETANILKNQLLFITFILLFTAIILATLLTKSFTRPILEINKVAMTMADGDLSARINLKRKDEIGTLGETINHMGEELSKVDNLRKDLIANVSHELKTPISLIKGYAETIKDISGDLPEKREKHLDIIVEESNRLSDMVQEILEFSQLQAGYTRLNQQTFNITDTLKRIYARFEILTQKAGINLIYNESQDIYTYGDEAKIEQVLYNLINNALNHSVEGGNVSLNITSENDRAKIEVVDRGKGIAENDLPYVWDRFYKVDKTGNRKIGGTGLGLAISKYILDAHGYRYGVDSKLGQGSKFWFEFKISQNF
ncbi:MAG: sensor histidine kinase [Anaerolineaceae bacterium]|nr:MAG: sensor histidine kinase [Anaerolineaceae bacterium]